MNEPNYLGLVTKFYCNMLESTLNLDIIFIEVRKKAMFVTHELILSILGLLNAGIVIREMKNDAKPHSEYDIEYRLPEGWIRKKSTSYMGELDIYVQYGMEKVLLQKHHDQHIMSSLEEEDQSSNYHPPAYKKE